MLLNKFFPIVDMCLSCEDIARQTCAIVPRWRFLATFLRPEFSVSLTPHLLTQFVTSLMCVCHSAQRKIIPTNLFLSHGNHEQYVGAPPKSLSCGTSSKPDHMSISSTLNTVSVANCGVHLSVIRKLQQNYE